MGTDISVCPEEDMAGLYCLILPDACASQQFIQKLLSGGQMEQQIGKVLLIAKRA